MVCANCGSGSHRTNHARCTKHCTLCRADGHRQKTAACRFRECSKCKAVGHSARECTGLVNREAESSFESSDLPHSLRYFPITVSSDRRMNEAERCSDDDDDADATACAMHVDNAIDGQSDDDGEDIMSIRGCNDDDRDDDDADDGNESEEADDAEAISVCQSCNSVGHKTRSHFKCPKHICTKCHTEGHNKNNCPQAQCPYCGLFGHVTKKDCKYRHCVDVEVDWLNIFLQVSALHNIKSFFDKKDCTVNPTNLRVDGKFREFTDWEQVQRNCAVTDEPAPLTLKKPTASDCTGCYHGIDRKPFLIAP